MAHSRSAAQHPLALALLAGLALAAGALHAEELPCDAANLVAEEASAPLLDLTVSRTGAGAVLCLRGQNHTGDVRLHALVLAIPGTPPTRARLEVLGIGHGDGARIEIPGPQLGGFPGSFPPPAGAYADSAESSSIGRHLGDGEVSVQDVAGGISSARSRAEASTRGASQVVASSLASVLSGEAEAHATASGLGSVLAVATASAPIGAAHARAEADGTSGFASATARGGPPVPWPIPLGVLPLDPRRLTASARAEVTSPLALEAHVGAGTLAQGREAADSFLAAADAPSADALAPFLSNARVAGAFDGVDEVLAIAHAGFSSRVGEAGPITLSARLGVGEAFVDAPLATPFEAMTVGFVAPSLAAGGQGSLRIRIGWVGRLVFDQTFAMDDARALFLDGGIVHVTPVDGPLDFGPPVNFAGQTELLSIWLDAVFDSPGEGLDFGVIVGATGVPEPALALLLALALAVSWHARVDRTPERRGS